MKTVDPGRERAVSEAESVIVAKLGIFTEEERELVSRALEFGKKAHAGQQRVSGEPYVCHPMRVAILCLNHELDAVTVAGALLHDVLEDTPAEFEGLKREFGEDIASLVHALTKVKRDRQMTLKRIFNFGKEDFRIPVVKLFDRIDNVFDLDSFPQAKQRRICRETLLIYADVAKSLGLSEIYQMLCTQCLRTLYPRNFEKMRFRLDRLFNLQKKFLENGKRKIEEAVLPASFAPDETGKGVQVDWILKTAFSQLLQREYPEMILNRFRIVTEEPIRCYTLVGYLHRQFKAVPRTFRDYVSNPTASGKRRLETTIMLEGNQVAVEITTRRFREINRLGVIELIRKGIYHQADYKAFFELYLDISKNDLRIQDIVRLSSRRDIQVFSPEGDCYNVHPDATVLDFAFLIHSDIGLRCKGAIIDNAFHPPSRKLMDGDMVIVKTNDKVKPDVEKWLKIVHTPKARKEIYRYRNARKKVAAKTS